MSEFNVVLAEYKGLGRVQMCSCSAIHLKVGPVTLNLEPEAFAQLTAMVRDASDRLTKIAAAREMPESDQPGTPNLFVN